MLRGLLVSLSPLAPSSVWHSSSFFCKNASVRELNKITVAPNPSPCLVHSITVYCRRYLSEVATWDVFIGQNKFLISNPLNLLRYFGTYCVKDYLNSLLHWCGQIIGGQSGVKCKIKAIQWMNTSFALIWRQIGESS